MSFLLLCVKKFYFRRHKESYDKKSKNTFVENFINNNSFMCKT